VPVEHREETLPDNAAEDSHDLLPLLKGEAESVRTTHIHNTNDKGYAIRHGDWLLINAKSGYISAPNKDWEPRHGYPANKGRPVELYNLKTDLGQRNNLAVEHPERVVNLQTLLNQIRQQGHSAPRLARP
jgi:arylsulfatase A